MFKDDNIILESLEKIYRVLENEIRQLQDIKSIHVLKIIEWGKEIRAYARIFEDISLPARMIIEHILELKFKAGQMAIETDNVTHNFSAIEDISIEEFGVIKISTGELHISWHDEDYNYLLYPDKVELRTADEKMIIKLFFSYNFSRQILQNFSQILHDPKVIYIHPNLKQYIDKEK